MVDHTRPLFLAVELDGLGSHPGALGAAGAAVSPAVLRSNVSAAETAGFVLATLDDLIVPAGEDNLREGRRPVGGRLDAGTRAAYLAPITSSIGLAPTVQALSTEPFFLATQLSSLDHASLGRGAWVIGADNSAVASAAVGYERRDAVAASREIRDVVDLSRRLWDSWEDDAVIRDVNTGRYLDPRKVHHVRFEGEFFDVVGPLITPRSPQGQIVVIGSDELGVPDLLDMAVVSAASVSDIASRATAVREAGVPLVFADIEVLVGTADASARQRVASLPNWPDTGRLRVVGSADDLVTVLSELAPVVDGVRFHLAEHAVDLSIIASHIVPALDRLGLHSSPRPGQTLRTNLGLQHTASRYAADLDHKDEVSA